MFDIKPLGYILKKLNVIPINREKPDISTIKNILKAIKDGYALGIFPEGTRVKEPGFGKLKQVFHICYKRKGISYTSIYNI